MNKTTGKNSPQKGDVFWVNFDPTQGTETKKTRPAVILSNNLLNKHLPRLLVAPITSNTSNLYDFDAPVVVSGKKGKVMLDQSRAIDKTRLGKKVCSLSLEEMNEVERALRVVFGLS